jgi:GH18 family chitinase
MEEVEAAQSGLDRRGFLQGALALSAGVLLAACGAGGPDGQNNPAETSYPIGGYFPTYLDKSATVAVGNRQDLAGTLDRIHVPFSVPTEDGGVEAPPTPHYYLDALGRIGAKSEIVVAVGGWSVDGDRDQMVHNLNVALSDPSRFVDAVSAMQADFAATIGRPAEAVGVDLDLEFPTARQADSMVAIAEGLRRNLPHNRLYAAIPPGNYPGLPIDALAPHLDVINLMTYDQVTSDGDQSGYLASAPDMLAAVDLAVSQAGDARKISVGLPAYGDLFWGANGPDQSFRQPSGNQASKILLKDVPPDSIDQMGGAQLEGAWTSVVTAQMARKLMHEAVQHHPGIGAFVYSIDGLPADYLATLRA